MSKLLDRLREPSSYAAVAAVLAMAGINIDTVLWQYIVGAASALAGMAGFFLGENGAPEPEAE